MCYIVIIILIFSFWILYILVVNFYFNNHNYLSSNFSYRFLGKKLIPSNNEFLEILWTVIPMLIITFLYLPIYQLLSLQNYYDLNNQFSLSNNLDKPINKLNFNSYVTLFDYNGILTREEEIFCKIKNFSFEKIKDISDSLKNFKSPILNFTSYNDVHQLKHLKVIGNQWYWMYETSYDFETDQFNLYDEDETLYSYLEEGEIKNFFWKNILIASKEKKDFYKFLYDNGFSFTEGIDLIYLKDLLYKQILDSSSDGDKFILDHLNSNDNNSIINYFLPDTINFENYIRLLRVDNYPQLESNCYYSFFITSYDVIHSWAIPSSGIKVDACPGRISGSKMFFKHEGFYYGQCSELCGFLHGFMPIQLKIRN